VNISQVVLVIWSIGCIQYEILVLKVVSSLQRLPHMHNNVGNAYRASGNLNKAVEHLERSKEMMLMMHYGDASEDMAKVRRSWLYCCWYRGLWPTIEIDVHITVL